MALAMDKSALADFMVAEFPQVADDFTILDVNEMTVRVRLNVGGIAICAPVARFPARRCSHWPTCRSTSQCWR